MNKQQIVESNHEAFALFIDLVRAQPDADFNTPLATDKWSMRQQVEHIIMTAGAIAKSTSYPVEKTQERFGIPSHTERDFDTIKTDYERALGPTGFEVTGPYAPANDTSIPKSKLVEQIKSIQLAFHNLSAWTEENLSACQIPHPLLGDMTIREITMFNSIHLRHHHRYITHYLEAK